MKFVDTRDLRHNPVDVCEAVEHEDVVLTLNGKPFAIAVRVEEDRFEETLDLVRQLRALRVAARMQRTAAERGLSAMTIEEINEEICSARQNAHRGGT